MAHYKPVLCVVAGPNGSGKTTFTEELFPYAKKHWNVHIAINPDSIALTQFGGYTDDAYREAVITAQALREKYIRQGTSFLFETVFSSDEKILFIKQAQAQGFFVRMFFIGTEDPQININRVGSRVIEGGHTVSNDKIIKRYKRSMTNLACSIAFCDYICVFDNSHENKEPQKIFRTAHGKLVKHYVAPAMTPQWCNNVLNALQLSCIQEKI